MTTSAPAAPGQSSKIASCGSIVGSSETFAPSASQSASSRGQRRRAMAWDGQSLSA